AISAGRVIALAISSAVIGVTITLLTPTNRASCEWRAHIAYVSGRRVTTTRQRSAAATTALRNSSRAAGPRLNTSSNSSITTIASTGAGAFDGSDTVGSTAGGAAIASSATGPVAPAVCSLVAAVKLSAAASSSVDDPR